MKELLRIFVTIWIITPIIMVTIEDDPDLWPGHLQPFGTLQKTVNVEEIDYWPSPTDFFKDYIDKRRPVLLKGLAKKSPAYKLWDDDYLRDHPGSEEQLVYVETEKKENRTKEGKVVTLKEFINIYHNSSIYMVSGCPKNVMKDVLIPPPLRCEDTRRLLMDAVTWFSSGGTKSVVHFDDLDNINCLFRGSKQLYFINNEKYEKLFEWTDGGYATVDVEKVDYVKQPQLRLIDEYIKADMEEGDCLFIPYKWIHQVTSKANTKQQNVAVNIWFKHLKNHNLRPTKCLLSEGEASIDKFKFPELEKQLAEMSGKPEPPGKHIERYEGYLEYTKKGRMNFKMLLKFLHKDDDIFKEDFEDAPDDQFKIHAKNLFDALDVTKDGVFNGEDLDVADDEEYEAAVGVAEDELLHFLSAYSKREDENEEEQEEETAEKRATDEL